MNFLRLVIVEPEVLGERVGQLVVAGIQNAIGGGDGRRARILTPAHRHARARVVGSSAETTRTRAVLGKDARVEVHVGEDRVRGPLCDPSVVRVRSRVRQAGVACRDQLALDEVKELAARVAGAQGNLGGGDDRNATEHVHEDVVVECPQRPHFGDHRRLVRHGGGRDRREKEVGARDAGIRGVPRAVKERARAGAARRPGVVVQIDPLAAVDPVLAADGHDDFVGRDLVRVVDRPFRRRAPQLRVHARQSRQHLRLVVEEVPRRNDARRSLSEVGASLHRQEQQRSQSGGCERHGCRKILHGIELLRTEGAGRR